MARLVLYIKQTTKTKGNFNHLDIIKCKNAAQAQ